ARRAGAAVHDGERARRRAAGYGLSLYAPGRLPPAPRDHSDPRLSTRGRRAALTEARRDRPRLVLAGLRARGTGDRRRRPGGWVPGGDGRGPVPVGPGAAAAAQCRARSEAALGGHPPVGERERSAAPTVPRAAAPQLLRAQRLAHECGDQLGEAVRLVLGGE